MIKQHSNRHGPDNDVGLPRDGTRGGPSVSYTRLPRDGTRGRPGDSLFLYPDSTWIFYRYPLKIALPGRRKLNRNKCFRQRTSFWSTCFTKREWERYALTDLKNNLPVRMITDWSQFLIACNYEYNIQGKGCYADEEALYCSGYNSPAIHILQDHSCCFHPLWVTCQEYLTYTMAAIKRQKQFQGCLSDEKVNPEQRDPDNTGLQARNRNLIFGKEVSHGRTLRKKCMKPGLNDSASIT